jgi:hypothetical protein
MRYYHQRARSGPHSLHDARQYAWSLLVFGPAAPAPRQRPHRGQLSDLPDVWVPTRASFITRLIALFTRAEKNEPSSDDDGSSGFWRPRPQPASKHQNDKDRLAA